MNIKTLHVSKIKNTHRLIIIVTFIMIGLFIFTFFNASFYQIPIGKITNIETSHGQKVTDEHHNTDTKYNQRLTIRILNGKYKNEITTVNNHFVKSQADSEQFAKNEKVLLHIQKGPS
ncbi:MAG: YibE/F family protein, partial [Staphylococcus sp.]|nr:YibE/F family protein [Staphylococcus sp.]